MFSSISISFSDFDFEGVACASDSPPLHLHFISHLALCAQGAAGAGHDVSKIGALKTVKTVSRVILLIFTFSTSMLYLLLAVDRTATAIGSPHRSRAK